MRRFAAMKRGAPRGGSTALDRPYAEALRQLPTLTAAEQMTIARRYARTRDPADGRRLVLGNLRLVIKLARQLGGPGRTDIMDLVQEGNAGLMVAVERFDPHHDAKLSTYAAWWIRAFIMRHLMDSSRVVRFGSTREGRRRFFDGALPGPDLSLDAPIAHDGAGASTRRLSVLDSFPAEEDWRPDRRVEEREQRDQLAGMVAALRPSLDAREQAILRGRLLSDSPARLRDIASRFHISRERARQLEQRIIAQLRRAASQSRPQRPAPSAAA